MGTLHTLASQITNDWKSHLLTEIERPYFKNIDQQVELVQLKLAPKPEHIFRIFADLPLSQIRVVILGQDPYHGSQQANGYSFSVDSGLPIPPSLRNIFKELNQDLACPIPDHGDLSSWVKQGVFLLNAALTVELGNANAHAKIGWHEFTANIFQILNSACKPCVFILWGKFAQQHEKHIDGNKHLILASPHPSPLGAYRGFWGSKPFSKANAFLISQNRDEINWCLK